MTCLAFALVIVYIDLEHDRFRQDPAQRDRSLAGTLHAKYRLESISGDRCLIVRYPQANPALLRDVNAQAVVVSACYTDFEHYAEADLAGLRAIYREAARPLLGICAGFQLLAEAYGAPIGPLGVTESGFRAIRPCWPHALLDGLGPAPVFFQAHYWEVKARPAGFEWLAESDLCALQVVADDRRRLYGTQFHPEEYDVEQPAGRRLLQNFFQLAGIV